MKENLLPRYARVIERHRKEATMKKARFFATLRLARVLKGYPKDGRRLLLVYYRQGWVDYSISISQRLEMEIVNVKP